MDHGTKNSMEVGCSMECIDDCKHHKFPDERLNSESGALLSGRQLPY